MEELLIKFEVVIKDENDSGQDSSGEQTTGSGGEETSDEVSPFPQTVNTPLHTPVDGPDTPVVYPDYPVFWGLSPNEDWENRQGKPHPDMEGDYTQRLLASGMCEPVM